MGISLLHSAPRTRFVLTVFKFASRTENCGRRLACEHRPGVRIIDECKVVCILPRRLCKKIALTGYLVLHNAPLGRGRSNPSYLNNCE